nr:vegetative cell wall protein gp1-like [Lolium perenne]
MEEKEEEEHGAPGPALAAHLEAGIAADPGTAGWTAPALPPCHPLDARAGTAALPPPNRRIYVPISAPVFVLFVLIVRDRHCRSFFGGTAVLAGTAGATSAALPLAHLPPCSTRRHHIQIAKAACLPPLPWQGSHHARATRPRHPPKPPPGTPATSTPGPLHFLSRRPKPPARLAHSPPPPLLHGADTPPAPARPRPQPGPHSARPPRPPHACPPAVSAPWPRKPPRPPPLLARTPLPARANDRLNQLLLTPSLASLALHLAAASNQFVRSTAKDNCQSHHLISIPSPRRKITPAVPHSKPRQCRPTHPGSAGPHTPAVPPSAVSAQFDPIFA